MYARLARRLRRLSVPSGLSRGDPCLSVAPSYRRLLEITSGPTPTGHLTRASSNSSCRQANMEKESAAQAAVKEPPTISYEELLKAQKDPTVFIIDIRNQTEINETGKLPDSIHIPMDQVMDELKLGEEEFKERYNKSRPNKETKIVVSCFSGVRSKQLAKKMLSEEYNVFNYAGGWKEYKSYEEREK